MDQEEICPPPARGPSPAPAGVTPNKSGHLKPFPENFRCFAPKSTPSSPARDPLGVRPSPLGGSLLSLSLRGDASHYPLQPPCPLRGGGGGSSRWHAEGRFEEGCGGVAVGVWPSGMRGFLTDPGPWLRSRCVPCARLRLEVPPPHPPRGCLSVGY